MTDDIKRDSSSIKVDPALWKEAKKEAIETGQKLYEYVEDALVVRIAVSRGELPKGIAEAIEKYLANKKAKTEKAKGSSGAAGASHT